MKASSGGGRSMMSSASAHLSPSPTPRSCMKRVGYFLALQEPAPQPPSLPFFLPAAGVAAGLAPGAGAAPGLAAAPVAGAAAVGAGAVGAGLAIAGDAGAA